MIVLFTFILKFIAVFCFSIIVSFFSVFIDRTITFNPFRGNAIMANICHCLLIGIPVLIFAHNHIEWWWIFPCVFISSFFFRLLLKNK